MSKYITTCAKRSEQRTENKEQRNRASQSVLCSLFWLLNPPGCQRPTEISSMPTSLTAEQILSLAPDPGSAKAGKGLSNTRKWLSLGCNERAAWGECQGSAREPYQTQIDLAGPVFRCSCP